MNFLDNGGFEEPLDRGWTWVAPEGTVVREAHQPHGGTWRLRVGSAQDHEATLVQVVNLPAGTYCLSAYTLWAGGETLLSVTTPEGTTSRPIDGSDGLWRNTAVEFSTQGGRATVSLKTQAQAGQWFVADDLTLTPTAAPEPRPEPRPDRWIADNRFAEGHPWTWRGAVTPGDGGAEFRPGSEAASVGQRLVGLEPGFYTLTAWAQAPQGSPFAALVARDPVSGDWSTEIPRTDFACDSADGWKKVTVRSVEVRSGSLDVVIQRATDRTAGPCRVTDLHLSRDPGPVPFWLGGDLTELSYLEAHGARFFDRAGHPVDPVEFAAQQGWNMARIREYNHPGPGRGSTDGQYHLPEGFQNPDDALGLCLRARKAGLNIQYSFHYSDWWSNPAVQNLPQAWARAVEGLSEAEAVSILETLVYEYTADTLTRLRTQGIELHSVALGNEIRGGLLYPFGTTARWDSLARFLNAGARAVRETMPQALVLLHLDDGGNVGTYQEFLGQARSRGVDYDLIGTSYYPYWTNKSARQFADFCRQVGQEFGKPLICMETAVNWSVSTGAGRTGQLEHNGPYGDRSTSSPSFQRDFLVELFNAMKGTPWCIGDLYWDPIMVFTKGRVGWALKADGTPDANLVDNTTLFDFEGRALPAWEAYRSATMEPWPEAPRPSR